MRQRPKSSTDRVRSPVFVAANELADTLLAVSNQSCVVETGQDRPVGKFRTRAVFSSLTQNSLFAPEPIVIPFSISMPPQQTSRRVSLCTKIRFRPARQFCRSSLHNVPVSDYRGFGCRCLNAATPENGNRSGDSTSPAGISHRRECATISDHGQGHFARM